MKKTIHDTPVDNTQTMNSGKRTSKVHLDYLLLNFMIMYMKKLLI